MIGLNEELAAREVSGNPVKIGLVGAGQMGVDVVAQVKMMKGIDVVICADIDQERARNAYKVAQVQDEVVKAETPAEADAAVNSGKKVYTADWRQPVSLKLAPEQPCDRHVMVGIFR